MLPIITTTTTTTTIMIVRTIKMLSHCNQHLPRITQIKPAEMAVGQIQTRR
jgi:hypothetical protein